MSTQLSRLVHCSMPRPPNRRRRSRRLSGDLKNLSDHHSISISTEPSSSDPNKVSAVLLDLTHLKTFLSAAEDAAADLRTLVSLDDRRRLVFSLRRSTIRFAGEALLLAFLAAAALRLVSSLLFRRARSASAAPRLVRRDRSLGGREVVVSAADPILPPRIPSAKESSERVRRSWNRAGNKLPKWWPEQAPLDSDSSSPVGKEVYQREADNLIREITDNRMSGKDIVADDILKLRRICRASGVRVSFDTSNTRDSFYRTSVDFVLNACARAPSQSTNIELAGEDIRQFIAGLAGNIGLESIRAARIVSAAVAARTRSRFLQAWALEMQGKHTEAMLELSKICLTFRIFPPEESSAEMEMVARGLEKHLKVEQREFLMDMLAGFCEQEIRTTAAEALGLIASSTGAGDQE